MTSMTSRRFADQTIFITGAGAGIGRAAALAFAREGAAVALIDMDEDGANETLDLVMREGGAGLAVAADVSDERSIADAFARAVDTLGGIDHAFNNAGVNQAAALTADISMDLWERIQRVNVTGVWLCMREELRHMAGRAGASIVNTASFGSLHSLPMQTAYVASKHAVLGMTKNAAIEYGKAGIRINAVAPGAIATDMLYDGLAGLAGDERQRRLDEIAALHPLNRYGQPSEIADTVLFLCSREAAFITGACVTVDGGWSAL